MKPKEQYKCIEWLNKSAEIRKRDNFTCQRCGAVEDEKRKFNAHHICYRMGMKVWEQDGSEIKTLCWDCHKYETEFVEIPIYDESGTFICNLYECFKCKGKGYLEDRKHYMKGICFDCRGVGFQQKIPLRVFLNPELIIKHKDFYERRHRNYEKS